MPEEFLGCDDAVVVLQSESKAFLRHRHQRHTCREATHVTSTSSTREQCKANLISSLVKILIELRQNPGLSKQISETSAYQ